MPFSEKYTNKIASPKYSSINVRKEPNIGSDVLFAKSNATTEGKVASAGRTTGDYVKEGEYTWYKLHTSKAVNGRTWGWVRNDVVTLYNPANDKEMSQEEAQSLVDKLVASDIKVYDNILKITPLLEAAEAKRLKVDKYKDAFKGLVTRLDERQNKLKQSKLLKVKTGIKKATSWLQDQFKSYIKTTYGIYGIGSVTAIVIGAIVGGAATIGLYYVFRPTYDESQIDLKTSAELEKALASLTPEEAATLKQNLEKQIDDAAKAGLTQGTFSGMFKIGKYILIAGAVYLVVSKFMSKKKESSNG